MPRTVATHQQPDADALVAAWLAYRFMFPSEVVSVEFVSRSFIPSSECPYDCVVDVGCQYDPFRLHFDHKPPAVADRHSSCASRMVWEYLLARGDDAAHLAGLIDAVHDGDSSKRRNGSLAYRQSQKDGLHAFVKRQRGQSDEEMWCAVAGWLDRNTMAGQDSRLGDDSRWQSYARGRVYLHSLEARDQTLKCRSRLMSEAWRVPGYLAWDKGWQVADGLCEAWRVDRKAVTQAAMFTLAVDRIGQACGNSDLHATLSGTLFKSRDDILTVGRREPERIRFAVEQVRLGKPPMKERPPNIQDTADFKKVTSRLGRAEGCLRLCFPLLENGYKRSLTKQGNAKRLGQIELQFTRLEANLPVLRDILRGVPTRAGITTNQTSCDHENKKKDAGSRQSFNLGQLDTFARILITNLPQLPDSALPTAEQKHNAMERVDRIQGLVQELRTTWCKA